MTDDSLFFGILFAYLMQRGECEYDVGELMGNINPMKSNM
jgi:hypothetical protein